MANAHSALRAERAGKIETRMISPAKLGDKPFVAIARVWLEFSQLSVRAPAKTLLLAVPEAQDRGTLGSARPESRFLLVVRPS